MGGFSPGGATALLVGLPLLIWRDPRAATLLVVITHIAAYVMLDRLVRDTLSARQRLLFAVFYWLNPWRIWFSGFLWNPNWLFLVGATHLCTAHRQRDQGSFPASFLHTAAIAIGVQLHLSAVVLVFASGLLVQRRRIQLHWPGAVAGAIVGSLTLIPWVFAVERGGVLPPEGHGFLGRGLLFVFPLLKAVGYWIRYGSLLLPERATGFDFTPAFGPSVDRWLAAPALWLIVGSGVVTSAFSVAANVSLWRKRNQQPAKGDWLAEYARLSFIAFLISVAISPTTPMAWQGVIVFHAAVLTLVLLPAERLAPWFAAASVAAVLFIGYGAPQFRCGGRSDIRHTLVRIHPLLLDLGIQQRCLWPVAPDGGRPIEDTLIGR